MVVVRDIGVLTVFDGEVAFYSLAALVDVIQYNSFWQSAQSCDLMLADHTSVHQGSYFIYSV